MPPIATRRTVRSTLVRGLLAASALAVMTSAPHAQTSDRYTLSGSSLGPVAIYDLAGKVTVVRGTGTDVVVTVKRGGRDAAKLRVETGRLNGRESLRVIFPGRRIIYPALGRGSNTETHIDENGTFGGISWSLFSGSNSVRISGSGSGLEAWADLEIAIPPRQATEVFLAAGDINATGTDSKLRLDTHSGDVHARGLTGDVTIDTGSGDVDVRDSSGDMLIDTGSGNVVVVKQKGERLSIDTGSGDVKLMGAQVSTLKVDTGSGDVSLGAVSADDVLADTGSGSVMLDMVTDAESVVLDTGSGEVTLGLPREFGAEYDISTGSGGIDIEVTHRSSVSERDEARGRIGDGRGRLRVDTGSGSVQIRPRASSSSSSSVGSWGSGTFFGRSLPFE
ncbi:MAG: DUF4097 family beta strand repeat protein [Candidatus Eisenbacteria bacterium]|uniref:DUF4097 family beta strand repeat protein n=1 Tax=Eiseniibacteriota bacterium TaxID=2212470 RepID=A0A849SGK8_UNCEI|nr:DUF4097 family beta strand repeat protein [Candidatus Eisenbacteria bacterium]